MAFVEQLGNDSCCHMGLVCAMMHLHVKTLFVCFCPFLFSIFFFSLVLKKLDGMIDHTRMSLALCALFNMGNTELEGTNS